MSNTPSDIEELISQIPALQVLMYLGYEYLTPEEALSLRGSKYRNVLLEDVLTAWLRAHNRIQFKGLPSFETASWWEVSIKTRCRTWN